MFKWIIALIGFFYAKIPGGIMGLMVGYFLESLLGIRQKRAPGHTYTTRTIYQQQTSPTYFELNLLSLSALLIKADGQVSQQELDYVRTFFVSQFGKTRANSSFALFNKEIKNQNLNIQSICYNLKLYTAYETRLQIIHFLFGVANADSRIHDSELQLLNRISILLGLHSSDFESIKAMFVKNKDNAYKILEIDRGASVPEIKKAYREMVKKYHPDRLTQMDQAYVKGAREKFEKVQEAYEQIKREKGF